MRLIGNFEHEVDAYSLYAFLKSENVDAIYEPVKNPHGIVEHYDVWIVSEDDYDKAVDLYEKFLQLPESARKQEIKEPDQGLLKADQGKKQEREEPLLVTKGRFVKIRKMAALTRIIIFSCVLLFFWTSMERAALMKQSLELAENIPYTEITQKLLYDFPSCFKELNAFFLKYPELDQKNKQTWTIKQRSEFLEINKIPYWKGYYDQILRKQNGDPQDKAPMFVQIKEGEYWRLISPIFLHGNFLHILFNMLWLFLLGREVEIRVGKVRYLALLVVLSLLSNTAQYLMSGPFFVGFSGVLCGLGGFVWIREKTAPWEGYQVQGATLIFLMVFVLGMMVLQSIAFVSELFSLGKFSVSQLGNTAHVTGLICGCILAKVPLFNRLKS